MKKIIFYFAIIGWISAYIIYLSTYAGIIINVFWIWVLHILVIAVWLPIGVNLKEITKSIDAYFSPKADGLISFSLFKYLFQTTPRWLFVFTVIGIFITIESFVTLLFLYRGPMQMADGEYFLYTIGNSKSVITEGEYLRQQSLIIRGHAGHWLLFLGLASCILYKYSGTSRIKIKL